MGNETPTKQKNEGNNAPSMTGEMPKAPSIRFKELVVKEFEQNSGSIDVSKHMERLIQSYFIKLDSVLKENETKRLKQVESKRDPLAFVWANVNMEKMAQDCVSFASMGLDPMQPNHIFLIPYKNNHTNKFDIGFLVGYKGKEVVAMKYGLDCPESVKIELVYDGDEFEVIKKDFSNPVESYHFKVKSAFNRGNLIGAFYYKEFQDKTKNEIRIMSLNDILKRKPKYASPEFWGGEKQNFNTKQMEKVEGWFEEMCYKTVFRAAYSSVTIDSEKINTHLVNAMKSESEYIQSNQIESKTEDVDFSIVEEKKQAIAEKKTQDPENGKLNLP